jgi:hypothetical protein
MPMSGLANASVYYERGLNFCVRLIASSAARLRLTVGTPDTRLSRVWRRRMQDHQDRVR